MWGFVRNLPPRRRVRAARKTELETLKRFQFWRRFQLKALLRFQFQCISWRRFNVSSSNALETFQRFQLERFQLKAVSSMSLTHPPTGDNKEKQYYFSLLSPVGGWILVFGGSATVFYGTSARKVPKNQNPPGWGPKSTRWILKSTGWILNPPGWIFGAKIHPGGFWFFGTFLAEVP